MRFGKRATNVVSSERLAKDVWCASDACAFFQRPVGCLGQRWGAASGQLRSSNVRSWEIRLHPLSSGVGRACVKTLRTTRCRQRRPRRTRGTRFNRDREGFWYPRKRTAIEFLNNHLGRFETERSQIADVADNVCI